MKETQAQQTIILHGYPRQMEDLADAIEDCRARKWQQRQWKRQPALVGPPNHITQYIGQDYDPQSQTLVSDAWQHDHCEICSWELHESADPEHGIGCTDGRNWLCTECDTKLIAP